MSRSLEPILTALSRGGWIAITDDPHREDEADLVIAAQHVTEEKMAFLIRHTSGIICVPMQKQRLQELHLELLPTHNPARFATPFTMPVDYKPTSRGGVSAEERTRTVRALIDPQTTSEELGRPGHVFPLQGHHDGLRGRKGHTEAALALMEMAGLYPAAVIGELMDDRGRMLRGEALQAFLQRHHIPLCSIHDISP